LSTVLERSIPEWKEKFFRRRVST